MAVTLANAKQEMLEAIIICADTALLKIAVGVENGESFSGTTCAEIASSAIDKCRAIRGESKRRQHEAARLSFLTEYKDLCEKYGLCLHHRTEGDYGDLRIVPLPWEYRA